MRGKKDEIEGKTQTKEKGYRKENKQRWKEGKTKQGEEIDNKGEKMNR